jgi:lipopolysaccharide heptosyltransferase III
MPSDLAHFYSRTRAARKVIVVDLGFLGDTVHLVPALWELKAAYRAASLHVLTSPVGAEVLALVPCVDRTWAIELQPDKRTLSQQWQVVRALRRERFDVAFNFSGADRTIFMTALTGARSRVGCTGGRQHFWNSWLIRNWAPHLDPNQIVFEQRRDVLAACGLPLGAARFNLKVDEQSSAWAATVVPRFALHLSINSAKATREWPLKHHVEMLHALWDKYPDLVVLTSTAAKPREQERLREFLDLASDARLQALPEKLSIPQLAAVLRRCRLHIGPDSGVLHLAVALEVPTVSFFREQGAYQSFLPKGSHHRVISVPCGCIDHHDAPCERLGRAECFAQIQPGHVAGLVCEELEMG